eukprot:4097174-Amphidinium_carterae.1
MANTSQTSCIRGTACLEWHWMKNVNASMAIFFHGRTESKPKTIMTFFVVFQFVNSYTISCYYFYGYGA